MNLKTICTPIQYGGLGVKQLLVFNNTLLGETVIGLCSGKGSSLEEGGQ
jgi:hypothetical protein